MKENQLQTQLKALVLDAQPQFRAGIEQDMASIVLAGANSFEDLFEILENKNAGLPLWASICWVLGRVEHTQAEEALFLALGSQEAQLRAASTVIGLNWL